jgi:SPP1 family predicted phage head-tail adaptor
MQGGRLRNLVEVWYYRDTADDFGEPIKTYEKAISAFAEIRPLLGRENFYEKMEVTAHTHKILMRYVPLDLDATMQIRWNNHTYEVIGQPSNWMERDIQWQFNVKEVFDADNYGH